MSGSTEALRVERAAEAIDVSRATIYRLLDAGELQSFSVGRSRRIPKSSIEDFIARRLEADAAAS